MREVVTYNDLTYPNSYIYKRLQQLEDERKELERQAERLRILDISLVNAIQYKEITNSEVIEYIIDMVKNTNLKPCEIIYDLRNNKGNN